MTLPDRAPPISVAPTEDGWGVFGGVGEDFRSLRDEYDTKAEALEAAREEYKWEGWAGLVVLNAEGEMVRSTIDPEFFRQRLQTLDDWKDAEVRDDGA